MHHVVLVNAIAGFQIQFDFLNSKVFAMTSYKELLKQRDALEQQIHEARKREIADAVAMCGPPSRNMV